MSLQTYSMNCIICNAELTGDISKSRLELRRCIPCYRTYGRERQSKWRKEKSNQQRKCPKCSCLHQSAGAYGNYCANCGRAKDKKRHAIWRSDPEKRKKDRNTNTSWRKKAKDEVIVAYGGKCSCPRCPETLVQFLSIDHISNDGAKHRKMLGRRNIHNWLRQQGFPKDKYQLLCRNCNAGKAEYGQCPHLLKTTV